MHCCVCLTIHGAKASVCALLCVQLVGQIFRLNKAGAGEYSMMVSAHALSVCSGFRVLPFLVMSS